MRYDRDSFLLSYTQQGQALVYALGRITGITLRRLKLARPGQW